MIKFKDVARKTVAELFDMLKEKVAEVESLKTQLNNMEQCYIQMKKERDDAVYLKNEHRNRRFQLKNERTKLKALVDSALGVCNENRQCIGKFMIEDETLALIDDIENALRGAP